jgi:hypothetical protein
MSVTSFIRSAYNADADEQQSRAIVIARMLLILFVGAVVAAVAVAVMLGIAALIWGGTIASIAQQIAGV